MITRRSLLVGSLSISGLVGLGLRLKPILNKERKLSDAEQMWVVPDSIHIEYGKNYDLKKTLPVSLQQNTGGQFSVSSSGQALPRQVILSSDGILSLTQPMDDFVLEGIVFSYES